MRALNIFILLFFFISALIGQNKDVKNTNVSGSSSLFGTLTASSDSNVIVNPYTYGVSVATTLKNKYITLPFSFRYANNGRSASYPFIRYGIAPKIKWAKFYLGNNSINFSRYGFAGLNVYGVGFEINPSIFYLGAFKGRIQKAVFVDSTDISYEKIAPRYKTNGIVIKAGIKSRKNAVLFTYAIANDVENSLDYYNPKFKKYPRKSKSIGNEIILTFNKNISYKFNGGMSIFTRNINGIDIDTFLKNSDENELPAWTRSIEKNPNITTQIAFAHDHQLSYGSKNFYLNLRYKAIQPEYKALGLANIISDITQMSVEPGFKLLKQKLNLNFVYGKQSNNLNNKLIAQNNNTILNVNAIYTPNDRYNASVLFSNFGIVTNAANPDQADSISIQNISSNLIINSYYAFSKSTETTNSINVSFSRQGLRELYEYNPLFNKTFNNTYANVNFNHSIPKGSSYSFGVNYNNSYSVFLSNQNIKGNVKSYGVNATYSILLWKEKLMCNINSSFSYAGTENEKSKPAFSTGVLTTLKLAKKSNLMLSYNLSKMTLLDKDIIQKYFNANITQNF